jgi:hypothetical protein
MSLSPAEIMISQLLSQHFALYLVKPHEAAGTLWLRVWWRPVGEGKTYNISKEVATITGLLYDAERSAVKIPRAMAMDIPAFLVRQIAVRAAPGRVIPFEML